VAGLFFGGGFYTYTAFRLAPVILFFALVVWWWEGYKRGFAKQHFWREVVMLGVTFFTALPIGWYFLNGHQDQFFPV